MRARQLLKVEVAMEIEQIAEELGVSRQRASQVLQTAMEKFKRELARRGYDGDSFLERICRRDNQGSEKLR